MAQPTIQPSFAAGELSPSLYARVDLTKYHIGAARLRNFFIDYRGGASNRSGTMFVGRCLSGINRAINFQFSTLQGYALIFSNLKMRVVRDGGLVTEPSQAISAISQANPGVLTYVGADPANGDWLYLTGIGGMTQLNGKTAIVANVNAGANTFELTDLDGVNINTTAYGAYTAGGTMARVFTLTTPYVAADLALLKYTQSADTMTITHPSYAPRQLTRTQHYAWTLTTITFQPAIGPPAGTPTVTPSAAGATTYSYVVTAVNLAGAKSVASAIGSTAASATMSTTAGANVGVTWAAVGGAISYNIYRAAEVPGGATPAGVLYGYVGSATGTAFNDRNINPDFTQTPPLANNPFATDFPSCSTYFQQRQCYAATPLYPLRLWMSKSGDFLNLDYSIPSREDDEIDITLASNQVNAIKHLVPMTNLVVLTASGAWAVSAGQGSNAVTPADVGAQPQAYNGCSDVPPIPINYDILYVQAKGSVVRALTYNVYSTSFTEARDVSVLSNHLFNGRQILEWAWAEEPFKIAWCVRDDGKLLSFTYLKEQDVYAWAQHDTLGKYKSICSVSEPPEDAVYTIIERLIGAQYLKYIERAASRQFNDDVSQAWFVDCGLEYPLTYPAATVTPAATTAPASIPSVHLIAGGSGYSGATAVTVVDPTGTGATFSATIGGGIITAINVLTPGIGYTNPTMVITDATGAGAAAQAILQRLVGFIASAGTPFASGDVGKALRVNGGLAIVTTFTDSTHLTANVINELDDVWPALSGAWSMTAPVTTVTGLDHLLGQTVSILADGSVEPQQVVSTLSPGLIGVTLTHSASAIFIGLPYRAQLQTLYVDLSTVPTMQSKRVKIPAVAVRVHNTRGLKIGIGFGAGELVAIKERTTQLPGQPIQLITGDERVLIPSTWKTPGQVCAQQDDPLPCTILGMIPEIAVGDTAQ